MTTSIQAAAEIFADARAMHSEALERFRAGDIRDAAEKAWCATKRATDALILVRTGREPEFSSETSVALRRLAGQDVDVQRLILPRYYTHQRILHGDCFYCGLCDGVQRYINGAGRHVAYAKRLAGM